jgi:hypothetical protein
MVLLCIVSLEDRKFNKRKSTRFEGNFFTLRLVSHAITEQELTYMSVPQQSDMPVFLNIFQAASQ